MACRTDLVLVLTNSKDVTTDFLEQKTSSARLKLVRINTDSLARMPIRAAVDSNSTTTEIRPEDHWICPMDVGAVYYRRPSLPELPRVSDPAERKWAINEFRKAWGGFFAQIPAHKWINHPTATTQASYKPEQLVRGSRIGLRVPDTLISTDPIEARSFCECLSWRVVAKPIGYGEVRDELGDTQAVVYTNALTESDAKSLSTLVNCPVILQEHIPKAKDLRVTIVDENVITVALHSQEQTKSTVDCRRDNMTGMRYSLVELPDDIDKKLLELVRSYRLRYAAIDLIEDRQGDLWFLELNPAGQWAWLEENVGAPISTALFSGFASAS